MTENGKIFIAKTNVLNFLAEQQLSVGLSLYIIKDIQQELEMTYNDIVAKQLKEEKENRNIQQDFNQVNFNGYPIKWEPEEENNQSTSDQAD